jgi:uncharacterized membrane protein
MLTLETIRADIPRLPGLVKLGIVLMVLAGLADVVAHLEVHDVADAGSHIHEHTAFEAAAHLAGFVSMVVIFVGVVLDGVRRTRARRPATSVVRKGVA